jgi:hypothetical protein
MQKILEKGMQKIKNLASITTEKYIVVAYEKMSYDENGNKQGGFYMAAIDRKVAKAEDLPEVYNKAEKIQDTKGCIERVSLFLHKGIVFWAFYESGAAQWRHRLCYGVYNEPNNFRTCTDQECQGKVTSITVGGLDNGAVMFWSEESECDNLYMGYQRAHFLEP